MTVDEQGEIERPARFVDSLIADSRYLTLLRTLAKSEEPVP